MASLKSVTGWFKGCVARLLPPCKRIVFLLSKAMDRPLPIRERLVVKTHLVICPNCQLCQGQLELMRELVRSGAERTRHDNPCEATLAPETKERLKKLLRSASSNL